MKIVEIEKMNEQEIREHFAPDFEAIPMKGFTLYLVDIADGFGYSMLICGDGRQIRWADDFELHYKNKSREELRELYLNNSERFLYTEEELQEPLRDYHDFERRRKFISELLPEKRDFLSMFHIDRTDDEKAERKKAEASHPVYCSAAYGFFTEKDKDYAYHLNDLLLDLLQKMEDTANNYDYQFSAFYYELGNHEYHINNYQGNWDVLSAFGNIPWRGQSEEALVQYFDDLHFTETQRKAFYDARRQFLKDADEKGWY